MKILFCFAILVIFLVQPIFAGGVYRVTSAGEERFFVDEKGKRYSSKEEMKKKDLYDPYRYSSSSRKSKVWYNKQTGQMTVVGSRSSLRTIRNFTGSLNEVSRTRRSHVVDINFSDASSVSTKVNLSLR